MKPPTRILAQALALVLVLVLALAGARLEAGPGPADPGAARHFADLKLSVENLGSLAGSCRMALGGSGKSSNDHEVSFWFAKPFLIRIESPGEGLTLYLDGYAAWLHFPERRQAVRLDVASGGELVRSVFELFAIRSFIDGFSLADVTSHFRVEVDGGVPGDAIDESLPGGRESGSRGGSSGGPRYDRLTFWTHASSIYGWGLGVDRIEAGLDARTHLPRMLKIWQRDDFTSPSRLRCRLEVTRLSYNVDIPPGTFRFEPPEGTRILDSFDVVALWVEEALANAGSDIGIVVRDARSRFDEYLNSPWGEALRQGLDPGSGRGGP